MDVKELRIGNLVHSPVWAEDVCIDLDNIQYHEDFTPIRVTDEMLIGCGFEQHSDYFTIKTATYIADNNNKPKQSKLRIKRFNTPHRTTLFVVSPANGTIIINYYHQLQNLYYALTGLELTIKETATV